MQVEQLSKQTLFNQSTYSKLIIKVREASIKNTTN